MKILAFGDLHLEKGNLDISAPALEAIVQIAERERPDLAVFTGDAVTRRGNFFPETAYIFRSACERIAAAAAWGLVAIDGNHDVLFDGSKSFVVGALSGVRPDFSETGRIVVVSGYPRAITFPKDGDRQVVVAGIPTFDRYRLRQAVEQAARDGDPETDSGIVETAVRGFLAGAKLPGVPLVALYHGSLAGARLDNEQVIRAGIDVPVRPDAFGQADLVLLGHIHRPQTVEAGEGLPPMVYNGATCPLTWGERRIEPSVVLATLSETGRSVEIERIPLPVVSDMIERTVRLDDSTPAARSIAGGLLATGPIPAGSRLRLHIHGRRDLLDSLPGDLDAMIAGRAFEVGSDAEIPSAPSTSGEIQEFRREAQLDGPLRSVTIVKVPTDDRIRTSAVEKDVSIVEAVGLWCDTRPEIDDEARRRLLGFSEEIENEVRDERLDAKFDFRPLRLRLRNFCQYGEAEVDFSDLAGVTMIRGANTAGKSNLARAIPFALYKAQRSGDVLSDLIRNGEDKAEVELEFEAWGDRYRIVRHLKRGKDRSASSVLFFDRQAAGADWSPAVEGTEAETQAGIDAIVGPASLFFAAAFADQNAIDALLDLRPAEMKDLLAEVLHRNFQARVDKGRSYRSAAEKDLQRTAAILSELDREADRVPDLEDQASRAATAISEKEAEIRAAGLDDDSDLRRREADLVVSVSSFEAELREADAARDHLADLGNDIRQAEAGIVRGEGAEADLPRLRLDVKANEDAKKRLVGIEHKVGIARENLSSYRQAKVEATASRSAAEGRAAVLRAKSKAQYEAFEREIELLEKQIAAAKKAAALVGRVPCSGKPFSPVLDGVTIRQVRDGAGCELLRNAVADSEMIDNLETDLAAERVKYSDTTKANVEALDDLSKEIAATEHGIEEIQAALDRAAAELANAEADLDSVKREIDRTSNAVPLLQVAESTIRELDLPGLRDRLTVARKKADVLSGKIAAAASAEAAKAAAERDLRLVRAEAAARREAKAAAEAGLAERRDVRSRVLAELAAAHKAARRRDELVQTKAEREVELRTFASYEAALGRDGVPFLLLEKFAIPEIRARVNHYLEPTPFRVSIETERTAVSSGFKAGVFVYFEDGRGRHPLSSASGFQRVAIGSGMRQAVSDLHAAATGTVIRLSVQDEGFGAYDGENIKGALETIRRIADRRETFLFVSHIEGMESVADHVVEVVPGADGSRIFVDEVSA